MLYLIFQTCIFGYARIFSQTHYFIFWAIFTTMNEVCVPDRCLLGSEF